MVLLAAESRWHFSRHVAWLLLRRLGSATCTAVSGSTWAASGGGRNGGGGGLSVGHQQALGIVASLWRGGSAARAQGGWGWGGRRGGSRAGGGRAALSGRRLGRCRLGQLWHCVKGAGRDEIKHRLCHQAHIKKKGRSRKDSLMFRACLTFFPI